MGSISFMRCIARAALCCALAGVVLASPPNDAPHGNSLQNAIPAESLSQALQAFVGQTGLQLAYPSELADGRTSRPAAAGLSPAAALAELLTGTGLKFTFLNSRTISIFETRPARAAGSEHAFAQSSGASASIPELLVTATKREEYLRDVPVSAIVLSPEVMSEAGVQSIGEIATMAPGVEYDFNAQWGGGVLTNVAIRGIDSKVGTSTTGIYIDDAPIQTRNGNFGNPYPVTFDLARVEILRGPQSTLFGAGAEGGAIRFIPKQPSTTESSALAQGEVAATEFGGPSYDAGAAVGGPLVDGYVGARFAAWYRDDAGYIDRVDPFTGSVVDKNSNSTRTEAMRLSIAVEPNDALRITPSIAYQSLRLGDSFSFYEGLSDPGDGVLRNGKLLDQPTQDHFSHAAIKLEYQMKDAILTATGSYFDRNASATVDTTNEAGAAFLNGFGNPLGPAYPTSYADAVPTLTSLHQIVLSQEVRLMSADRNARLRWTVGASYSQARHDEGLYAYLVAAPAMPAAISNSAYTDTSVSGFGNLEVLIAPRWSARVGLRFDDARSVASGYSGGLVGAGTPPFDHVAIDARPLTPQFDLEYESADRQDLVYASITKGFRIGGINTPLPDQCGANNVPLSYDSDSVWNYEIGTKRRAFDGRLQLSAAAFYFRWNNIQQNEVPPCELGFTANAGNAIGKGFDLSADALLSDNVKAGVAMENLDDRYTRTVIFDRYVIVDRGAAVGGVPHVPAPWTASVYVRYGWPVSPGLQAYARADETIHSHNPGPFSELDPQSISYSPRYTADPATYLLNLRLGVAGTTWDAQIYANNALNSLPVLQRNADTGSSSLVYAYTFRPRTVGIIGSLHF
jgi:outer membrane receptor protein involved in Fe transport